MQNQPRASVIIPVWNGYDCVPACLRALCAQNYPDFEILVVDNASPDGAGDVVERYFPQARLLRASQNLGFSGGCNLGLHAAQGDILILLNQDTVVSLGWLKALSETATSDPSIGIVGCKTLYPDGTIQHAGGMVNVRGETRHIGAHEQDLGQYDLASEVDFVTGAALTITRRAYEQVGDLDEGFSPAYYEDVDWCYRAREAGFRVVYTPAATLIHAEHSLASSATHQGMYDFHHHRLRFVLKHWPREALAQFAEAEQEYLHTLAPGGERLAAALYRSYLTHLLFLDDLMQWRAKLLGSPGDEVDALAGLLLRLRATVSLPYDVGPTSLASIQNLLDGLQQLTWIEAKPLEPQLKRGGRIIGALRKWVYDHFTAAYLAPVIQQQTECNRQVSALIERMLNDRLRLAEVLTEYDVEARRELADLALELRRLHRA
ncbi:MAG TPA: glycosyltransferase family 2 protein [Anaerolineae bacterium]|nr:glycosyltransferase family 2 protein [Anaerolineae bacterium]